MTKTFQIPGWTTLAATFLALGGCVGGPVVLHEAVLSYDRTVSQITAELLLMNIARVKNHRPIHFTTVSSVAATFSFQVSAQSRRGQGPTFGGAYTENPTITILPVEGEEFNQRVLNPFTEVKFQLLMQQGTDLGLLLRIAAAELRLEGADGPRILRNRPARPAEFEEFRRCVLHLVALHEAHELFIDPVIIEQNVTIHASEDARADSIVAALDKGYRWNENGSEGTLTRKLAGRAVIANYDIDTLPVAERRALFVLTKALGENDIYVDIRSGYPGGEHPMRGRFRLRSFLGILGAVARSLEAEPEFAVAPRLESDHVRFSPVTTLSVVTSQDSVPGAAYSVTFEGTNYAIPKATDQASIWNLEAFRLLMQLYELSVRPAEFSRPPPAITIAK